MLKEPARRMAEEFKRRLLETCPGRILEVRVFGSMARGDDHPDSDLDVFVMVDERDDELHARICRVASRVWMDLEEPYLSPRVMSKAHFESLLSHERRIAQDILNEGIPI